MKVILLAVAGLFCIASYYDLKYRIIPNITSFGIIILGMLYHILNNGMAGLKVSLIGVVIGFVFFLILYMFKMMGAGDVKLGAGAGSILGIKIVPAVVVIVFIGGLIAIIQITNMVIKNRVNSKKMKKQNKERPFTKEMLKQSVPYGLAISIGTILTLIIY